jgi:hypothetical protein
MSSKARCGLPDDAVCATYRFLGLMLGDAAMRSALLASGLLLQLLPLLEKSAANDTSACSEALQARLTNVFTICDPALIGIAITNEHQFSSC